MPAEVGVAGTGSRRSLTIALFLVAFVLLTGSVILVQRGLGTLLREAFPSISGPPVLAAPSEIEPASVTDIAVLGASPRTTETAAPEATASHTPLAQPTNTGFPPNVHDYEVIKIPAGSDQGFLVHKVSGGETLDSISADYDTSVAAIIAVNYELLPPVWADYPIVIPVNREEAAGLPAFDIYVVKEFEVITAESLAEILGVDAAGIELYNMCAYNCQFAKGDVLLIPRTP